MARHQLCIIIIIIIFNAASRDLDKINSNPWPSLCVETGSDVLVL